MWAKKKHPAVFVIIFGGGNLATTWLQPIEKRRSGLIFLLRLCTYLWNLERSDSRLQSRDRRRAGHVLPCFFIELQLCQQGLLLLPEQMQPLLFLQLMLPLQLVLFLPVVVVEHLAAGSQVDVLFPQYVDEVHVLKGTAAGFSCGGYQQRWNQHPYCEVRLPLHSPHPLSPYLLPDNNTGTNVNREQPHE